MIRIIHKIKAQSLVEYSLLVIIVIAILLATNSYVKRGIQGRWKASIDDFGEQYDPARTNAVEIYIVNTTSNTMIDIVPFTNGTYWTRRVDSSNSVETRDGTSSIGSP